MARQKQQQNKRQQRLLYIVIYMAEFESGRRRTSKGTIASPTSNTIVPVMHESVASMVQAGYAVDVYFVAHYNVSASLSSRHEELSSPLIPEGSLSGVGGVQIWDEATWLRAGTLYRSRHVAHGAHVAYRTLYVGAPPLLRGMVPESERREMIIMSSATRTASLTGIAITSRYSIVRCFCCVHRWSSLDL